MMQILHDLIYQNPGSHRGIMYVCVYIYTHVYIYIHIEGHARFVSSTGGLYCAMLGHPLLLLLLEQTGSRELYWSRKACSRGP